jgi:hypothetical protein
VADLSDLPEALGIRKVPHFTTLFHARRRLAKKGTLRACRVRSSDLLMRRA